jgi:hypothetical protein
MEPGIDSALSMRCKIAVDHRHIPGLRLSVRRSLSFIAPSNEGALKWNIFKHLGWNIKIICAASAG